jgi:hypothetical protein
METKELKLSLNVDRGSYVRSESINAEVSLMNISSQAVRIEDMIMSNNPLHLHAINNFGKEFSGSLQSPRARDGLRFPPIKEKSMILLEPKNKITIKIDLLDILGELTEGDYEVKATYVFGGMLFVESKPVSVKVLKSTPNYSKTYQDYLRINSYPVRTTWINSEEDGFYLFIMENSQHQPSNIRSNRRILKTDEPQRTCPSILASPEQLTEHVMWIQEEPPRVATLEKRVLKDFKKVKLPIRDFKILEPPFTSIDGNLHFVVMSKEKDTTTFRLIGLPNEGKIEMEEICRFGGDFTRYCIIHDEESRLHMVWASESGSIFYTWYDLEQSIKAEGEPKMVVTCKPPILDLQLSKACEDEEGNLQLLLHFANCEFPNELHSHLINVGSKKELSHSFFPLPELGSLVLIQTVLDLECRPHYLFQDRAGALWFKAFEGAELVRVTEEGEAYPGNVDYPVLLVSSNMSRHYGIYLRYIKDKSSFVYKKLQSLTMLR